MSIFTQIAYLLDGIARNVDISSHTLHVNTIRIGTPNVDIDSTIASNLVDLQNGTDFADGTNAHTHDARYYTQTQLNATNPTSGASLIGIRDIGSIFTSTTVEGALQEAKNIIDTSSTNITHLISLTGVVANSDNLGSFTGITIPDNVTIKSAIQYLETAVETKANDNIVIKKDGSVAFTANQSMGNHQINDVSAPTLGTDAANKTYVDDNIYMTGIHPPVSVASVGLPLSSYYGTIIATGSGIGKTLSNGGIATSNDEVFSISGIYKITSALTGKYFTYYYNGQLNYVWFQVDGNGVDPAPGGTGTMISALTGDLFNAAIANATLPGIINAVYDNNKIFLTIQAFGVNQIDAADGNTGANITVVQQAGDLLVFSLDGYYPLLNSRILIKDENDPINNGIYVLTNTGYGNVAWILTRVTDCDGSSNYEISSAHTVYVKHGQQNNKNGFIINDFDMIIVDTDPIIFTQFTGLGLVSCQSPIIKNGNTLSFSASSLKTCVTQLQNLSGSTINANLAVYIKNDGSFDIANSTSINTSLSYIGITINSSNNNDMCDIAIAGESPTITIAGSPVAGDRIYLDTANGTFTNVAPNTVGSTVVFAGIYIGNNKIAMQTQFIGVNN